MKKVYILLINFNGVKFTIECLKSILKNNYKLYQIVIIDNCSTDNSVDQINQWIKNNKKVNRIESILYNQKESEDLNYIKNTEKHFNDTYKTIVIIKADINKGFAAGNNIGIKFGLLKGDADYFWLLNNDTEIEKDALVELVKLSIRDPKIGIVGSRLLFYDYKNKIQSLGNDHINWRGIGHGSFDGILYNDNLPDNVEMKAVMGASLLIKTKLIDKIGLMDELYFMQHEEADWCFNALNFGYKILTSKQSIVFHKDGKSTGRNREIKSFLGKKAYRTNISDFLMWGYYSFRNEIFFIKKNFESKFIWYILMILPIKYVLKIMMVFLYNDDYKIKRIYLLTKAVIDGLIWKTGKTIDPGDWRKQFL